MLGLPVPLVHALSVEPGDTSLDPDGLLDPIIILATTAGLVHLQADTVGAEALYLGDDQTVRFVHYTVQEYLIRNHSRLFPEGNLDICHTCLIYLGFDDFLLKSSDLKHSNQIKFPFLVYAVQNWIAHASTTQFGLISEYVQKIVSPRTPQLCHNWLRIALYDILGLYDEIPIGFAVGIVCYQGALNVVQILLNTNIPINVQLPRKWTPLKVAVRSNHSDCVALLLGAGANVNYSPDDLHYSYSTPLYHAVQGGSTSVIQKLIDKGVKLDENPAALIETVNTKQKYIVQLLLRAGCNSNAEFEGNAPLGEAAARDLNDIVAILLDAGAEINCLSQAWNSNTPLQYAIGAGQWATVIQLLDAGADLWLTSESSRDVSSSRLLEPVLYEWRKDSPASRVVLSRFLDAGVSISHFENACWMIEKINELRSAGVWESIDHPVMVRLENEIDVSLSTWLLNASLAFCHHISNIFRLIEGFLRITSLPTARFQHPILTGIPLTANRFELREVITDEMKLGLYPRLFYSVGACAPPALARDTGASLAPLEPYLKAPAS